MSCVVIYVLQDMTTKILIRHTKCANVFQFAEYMSASCSAHVIAILYYLLPYQWPDRHLCTAR